jgi:hypothetical protein
VKERERDGRGVGVIFESLNPHRRQCLLSVSEICICVRATYSPSDKRSPLVYGYVKTKRRLEKNARRHVGWAAHVLSKQPVHRDSGRDFLCAIYIYAYTHARAPSHHPSPRPGRDPFFVATEA